MSPLIQWLLVLAGLLLALAAAAALLELRLAAREARGFFREARRDLASVTEDVHALRLRLERVADAAAAGLEMPRLAGRFMARAGSLLAKLLRRPGIDLGVTALKFAVDFLLRPRGGAPQAEKRP